MKITKDIDLELDGLSKIIAQMEYLAADERQRVLQYLCSRYAFMPALKDTPNATH